MKSGRPAQLHLSVAFVIALLLLPGPAAAYVRAIASVSGAPLSWRKSCVTIRPDASGVNHVRDSTELEVIERSAENWNEPAGSCSYLRLLVTPPAPLVPRGFSYPRRDDVAIFWVEKGWDEDPARTPATIALTALRYRNKPGSPEDGEILDADLEINAEHFELTLAGSPGTVNVETTITHELGHVLGLDHTCSNGGSGELELQGSTVPSCDSGDFTAELMYPSTRLGDAAPRRPTADEMRGICAIYPASADPGVCRPAESGGCGMDPDPAAGIARALVLLVLLALAVAGRRRS